MSPQNNVNGSNAGGFIIDCRICMDDMIQDIRTGKAKNILLTACCKLPIHKTCWIKWEESSGHNQQQPPSSNIEFRRCIVCNQNVLPMVGLSTILYKNSVSVDYCRNDLSTFLKTYTANTDSPDTASDNNGSSTSGVSDKNDNFPVPDIPYLKSLVLDEMKQYSKSKKLMSNGVRSVKRDDFNSGIYQPLANNLESLPMQACHTGNHALITEILKIHPELARVSIYSAHRKRKLPMSFVAADNQHTETVKKLAKASIDRFNCSLTIAINDDNIKALKTLVSASSSGDGESEMAQAIEKVLSQAIQDKNQATVSKLLKAGVNLQKKLDDAISANNLWEIIQLIEVSSNKEDIFIMVAQEKNTDLLANLFAAFESDDLSSNYAAKVAANAAKNKNTAALKTLKESGVDLSLALTISAGQESNSDAIQALLTAGANIYNALSQTTGPDQANVFNTLLTSVNPNEHLLIATQKGNKNLVDRLLIAGVDPSAGKNDCDPANPFLIAAANSHCEIVKALRSFHRADERFMIKAIYHAALYSEDNILLTLLRSYDSDEQFIEEITAVVNDAISNGQNGENVLKRLVKIGNESRTGEILINAAIRANSQILKHLLNAGADANTINSNGQSLLHIAACKGDQEVVKLLLASGAMNTENRTGDTPLFLAASNGHKDITNTLIKAAGGQDINTELEAAVGQGDYKILSALLGLADIGGKKIRQLLQLAASSEHSDIIGRMRLKNPVSVEIAYAEACANSELEVICKFLKAGIGRKPDDSVSLLLMAAVKKEEEKVKIMIQNGVEVSADIYKAAAAQEIEALSVMLTAFADIETKNQIIEDLVSEAVSNDSNDYQAVFSSLVSIDKQSGTVGIGNILFSAMSQRKNALESLHKAEVAREASKDNFNHFLQNMEAEQEEHFNTLKAFCESNECSVKEHKDRVRKNDLVIQSIIRAGADFNITDNSGQSLLSLAVQGNFPDVVIKILADWLQEDTAHNITAITAQQTASMNNRGPVFANALILAVDLEKWEMVELLLTDVNRNRGVTDHLNKIYDILYNVAKAGKSQLVKTLWGLGIRATPSLNKAIGESDKDLVISFVQADIKLNAEDVGDDLHPLLTAITLYSDTHPEMVELLLSITENVEKIIFDQALSGQKEVVTSLWRFGGEQRQQVFKILTLALDAAHPEKTQIFKTLKETHGVATQLGQCLCDAALQGNQILVQELLNIDIETNPLKMTISQFLYQVALEHPEIASMLLNDWKGRDNKNCALIIDQASGLAQVHNDERNRKAYDFLNAI